ncbi:hypothetical protein [Candidatus Electronema sp. JC]|uniref:hypothetical protein n=1 Tax=Candidatus Electronema sp. JC TaxID=3401570 RepID=UPI003B429B8E
MLLQHEIRYRLKSIFLLLLSIIIFSSFLAVGLVFPSLLASLLKRIFLALSACFSFSGFLAWKFAEDTEAELKEAKGRLSKQLIQEDVDA